MAKKPYTAAEKFGVAVVSLLFLLVIGTGLFLKFGTSQSEPAKEKFGPPIGTFYPSQGHPHVSDREIASFHYNADPPVSGPHQEIFPTAVIFDQQMPTAVFVHMQEHANVMIAYHNISLEQLTEVQKWVSEKDSPFRGQPVEQNAEKGNLVFLTPWATVPEGKIVLCAWTRQLVLNKWDPQQANQFLQAWLGNANNANQ